MKVSCIIPTYNRPEMLEEAVACILAQSTLPLELLVINNGEHNVKLRNNSDLIRIVNIMTHAGVSQARNTGAVLARGDYLAFLDDDDLWEKKYLEKISTVIDKHAPDCIITRKDRMRNGTTEPYKDVSKFPDLLPKLLVSNPGAGGQNIVIRKSTFMVIGGFDPKLTTSEDKSLIIELLRNNRKVIPAPHIQAIMRVHDEPRLTDHNKMAEGKTQFLKKYGSIMTRKQKIINKIQIYHHRYKSGEIFVILPLLVYKISLKLLR